MKRIIIILGAFWCGHSVFAELPLSLDQVLFGISGGTNYPDYVKWMRTDGTMKFYRPFVIFDSAHFRMHYPTNDFAPRHYSIEMEREFPNVTSSTNIVDYMHEAECLLLKAFKGQTFTRRYDGVHYQSSCADIDGLGWDVSFSVRPLLEAGITSYVSKAIFYNPLHKEGRIISCEDFEDNFVCSDLDVAVSFDMPSEVRDSSLSLKEVVGNAAPGFHAGVSDDGLMLPIGEDSNNTNVDVIVYMVNVENDASAPREKFAYPFQKEFLNDYVQNYYKLRTDYILVVENHSPYPYTFSPQYAASGYDCLELDFLTSDKRILTASKRMPCLLSDRGEENLLKPNWQWKYLISLDARLWKKPDGFSVDLITHFRPRFAYGAFFVDGKYYRTSAELEAHKRKGRPFKSREGELVGNWMHFQPKQRCWQSWK